MNNINYNIVQIPLYTILYRTTIDYENTNTSHFYPYGRIQTESFSQQKLATLKIENEFLQLFSNCQVSGTYPKGRGRISPLPPPETEKFRKIKTFNRCKINLI